MLGKTARQPECTGVGQVQASCLEELVSIRKGKGLDALVLSCLGPIPSDFDLTGLECSVLDFTHSLGDSNIP